MANKLYDESKITDIGRAIQIQLGVSSSFSVAGMAAAIFEIKSMPTLSNITISFNGEYNSPAGYDGFSHVVVSVPGGASAVLGSKTIFSNGIYDASADQLDGFSQVTVSIPEQSAVLGSLTVSANGSYTPPSGIDGFNNIVVNVPDSGGSLVTDIIEGGYISLYNSSAMRVRSYAFYEWSSLKGVDLPAVSMIKENAFCGCSGVSYISLPQCQYIESSAFSGCRIESIILPECKRIYKGAFSAAGAINGVYSFYLPKCSIVEEYAFYGCGIHGIIELPEFTDVPAYCFALNNLSGVILPECIEISTNAFYWNSTLSYVSAPVCRSIRPEAFKLCTRLTEITLPRVSNLSAHAFADCTRLESIYLLYSSVCRMLDRTTFENTPMSVSSYLGYYGSIFVPESLVDAYRSASGWAFYSSRITAYNDGSPDVVEEEEP